MRIKAIAIQSRVFRAQHCLSQSTSQDEYD